MKPKRLLFILFFSFIPIPFSQTSFAQIPPLAPSSINTIPLPVGSGARALGQGGAFIAVADDATAASWNPGGLTQLERPELSVVGSYLSVHQEDIDPSGNDFSFDNETIPRGDLNYTSIAYPFRVFGKNIVVALNYQQVYDFHNKLDYKHIIEVPPFITINQKNDFESKGGIGALTPAIAVQVMPRLSIGVAVNVYTDEFFGDFAWKETTLTTTNVNLGGIILDLGTSETERTFKNFQAINVVTGLLWDVWEKEEKRLTFGAVYHSPFTADVDRITEFTSFPSPIREHFEIDYPMSFGAGLGFRYSDALSFSMDVTWTDWSEFEQENKENGSKSRPLGSVSTDRDIDDTYAVRFGTEYLLFTKKIIIPIRGGLFYDPRPSLDNPTHVYGVSVGSGITFKRFSIDGAYQFRWVNNINGEDYDPLLSGTKFDINEHLFLASIIVYF